MGQHKALYITLIIWIPIVVLLCAAVVVWVVLPNSKASEAVTVNLVPESRISPSTDNTAATGQEQVVISSDDRSRGVLFVLGIIFAGGLFVFLLVIITVVCVWARQARGYAIGQNPLYDGSVEVAGNEEIQLKDHSNGGISSIKLSDSKKEEKSHNSSLVNISSPPLKTVVVAGQVKGDNSEYKSGPPDEVLCSQSPGDIKPTHPQNYGTLSRTRLLSSVDEDGYHIDNLGFDLDGDNSNCDFLPTSSSPETSLLDENTRNLLEKLEEELQKPSGDSITTPPASSKTDSTPGSRESSLQRQLTKEDSFQGLPPLNSFDNYLTLVRLDSTTSLSSISLEEAKKQWLSIEEEEEETENLGKGQEIDDKEKDA